MRISGGTLRGREVPMPPRGEVRPTPSRVREALFSMLGQDLSGWSVLDGFAGAGLLGLEALSRGAAPLTLCERDPAVANHLRKVLHQLGVHADLVRGDTGALLADAAARGRRWDLVLLDPPYAEDPALWLERAAPVTARVLVIEHRWGPTLAPDAGGLEQERHRRYGDTGLALYSRSSG